MKTLLLLAVALAGFAHAAVPDEPLVIQTDPGFHDWPGVVVTANVEVWTAENPLPPAPLPVPAEIVENRIVLSAPRYLADASLVSQFFGPGRRDRLHLAYQRLPFFLG